MRKGFTLIELLLYIGILTIFLTALMPFGWSVILQGAKSETQQEVYANARFVSEKIKYEIRRASGITTVSASSISLTNFSPDSTTVIDVSGGKARMNKNGAGFVNLNSNDTTVTALTFTNYTSADNRMKNIGYELTMTSSYTGNRQEYKANVTLRGDSEVRSN